MDSLDITPTPGSKWRHYNGTPYTVLHIANSEGDDPSKREKYPPTVVYQGPNGKVWARPLSDWHRSMQFEEEATPHVGDGASDAAVVIGEHAFRAGYAAALKTAGVSPDVNKAWSEYDPPEDIKALA